MRLADAARKHGIDAFTAEDFNFVSSKVTADPDRLILVGGQALEVLGLVFDVPSPFGEGNALTEDADWLGSKQDAQWLCDKLGDLSVEVYFPSRDDTGSSSALAYLQRGPRILMMDFLHSIVGPDNDKVRSLAVPVTLNNGAVIQVLHPLLCLESRLANLKVLPEKRRGNGPAQAKWAINIVRAFLDHLAGGQGKAEQLAKACRMVFHLALSDYAKFCLVTYRLNPMKAITDAHIEAVGGDFAQKEWPVKAAQVRKRHGHWLEVAGRKMQHVPGSVTGGDESSVSFGEMDSQLR